MSQNIHHTSSVLGRVRVRAGWDVPLGELYCSVELLDGDSDLNAVPNCFREFVYPDLHAMREALSEAEIFLPDEMQRAIAADLLAHTGNVIREF
jgi:hypothetical protein